MNRVPSIGIIGGGMISQIAHLPFYASNSNCRVAAIAESRPSLITYLSAQFPWIPVVPDYRDLLSDTHISAAILVAPRAATGPLALKFLAAGKDVMVEKPLAHTVKQAKQLVEVADSHQRLLAVAFMKRYDSGVQAAKFEVQKALESRRMGQLQLARFYDFARDYAIAPPKHKRPTESRAERFDEWPTAPHWLAERHRDAYAWFMNAASHDVNLIRYFFPDRLLLMHAASPSEGVVVADFKHGEHYVQLQLARSANGEWKQGAEFVFEKGRIHLEIPSPMAIDKSACVSVSDNGVRPSNLSLPIEPRCCFEHQANCFVEDLIHRKKSLTSGADALGDLVLIEKIWRKINDVVQ